VRRGSLLCATAALLAAVALPFAPPAGAADPAGPRVGDRFPSRRISDLEGTNVEVPGDFPGKVLVLYFWKEGCSGCREEMPALEALSRRFAPRGLAVLAVNVGQPRARVRAFVAGLGASPRVLLDPEEKAARGYGVPNVPRTYLIDCEGVLRYRILGEASEESLARLLLALL